MTEICKTELCTGCMACLNSCPKEAIVIFKDSEGFERPKVNQDICVDCKLCQQRCPVNNAVASHKPLKIYSGWSKDENTRLSSSSGGAFWELANTTINAGGYVVGCALNDEFVAYHLIAHNIYDLEKLKGSKYTQSHIGDIYKTIKVILTKGVPVLFSGTPCQVAGLLSFLNKPYQNLITVDIICHGVPSPQLFEDYKEYIKDTNGIKCITSIFFRKKKTSWILYNTEIVGKATDGALVKYEGEYTKDPWIRGFLSDNFLRPSCYSCQYSKVERVSDITIADWWTYKPMDNDYTYVKKGVSSITCNSEKGLEYLKRCMSSLVMQERTLEDYIKTNPSLVHFWSAPLTRSAFWNDYSTKGFKGVISEYMPTKKLKLSEHISMVDKSSRQKRLLVSLLLKIEGMLNKCKMNFLIIKY